MAAYVVPQGWVENYTADNGHRAMVVFHASDQCDGIRHAERLRPVPRPGSAARCRRCAAVDGDLTVAPRRLTGLTQRSVEVAGGARRPVLRLVGEHDISTRERIEAACDSIHLRSGVDELTIDLTRTSFADCSVIGLLIALAARARRSSVAVTTRVPSDGRLDQLLQLLGADLLLGVQQTGDGRGMADRRRGNAAARAQRAVTSTG